MMHAGRSVLQIAVLCLLCLLSGCRRPTPISDLWTEPKAWEGKRVFLRGVSCGPCQPDDRWGQGFTLSDDPDRSCDISVFTDGPIPAEGGRLSVEGVVRVVGYTVCPQFGPSFTSYLPVIEADFPGSRLLRPLARAFRDYCAFFLTYPASDATVGEVAEKSDIYSGTRVRVSGWSGGRVSAFPGEAVFRLADGPNQILVITDRSPLEIPAQGELVTVTGVITTSGGEHILCEGSLLLEWLERVGLSRLVERILTGPDPGRRRRSVRAPHR